MSYQNDMMDRYNYYNDSRVRSSMFSSCWSVVHEEAHEVIITVDDDFLLEDGPVGNKLDEIVEKWIADEEGFTEEYRKLQAAVESRIGAYTMARAQAIHDHGVKNEYSLPRELGDELSKMNREHQESNRVASQSRYKLWQKANEEHLENVCEELGFQDYHDQRNDQTYNFCMNLPSKYEVCDECSGSGKVVNPSIDAGGISYDDFHEDPDFEEDYFSGRYDVNCPSCNGKRVQSHPQFPEWLAKAIQDRDESVWDGINENCAELRMGA